MLDKTFNPKDIESRHYQDWEQSGVFACDPESKDKPYTIMMPPPNVTGSLHMGHALNASLQDFLIRYHRMKGFDALWQPGTDHASIAVHMVLEKQLAAEGKTRQQMSREAFLEMAWKWKEYSGSTITTQLRRLGTTPDWARERFTMDEGLSKAVTKVFVELYKKGLIYRDKRLVHWDPERKTVISDLEVIQKEQKGHLWHIRYEVEGDKAEYITVATTRPETLLGDTAVAVHPDDDRYKHMIGKMVSVPVVNRLVPIIADEYADPEQGSGAVKITPAHDFNDFEVGKRHKLQVINILDEHARLNENAPDEYQGLDRFEARKKILAELEGLDLLAEVEDIKHTVPYGERSGVVIEPYLTDQWYCDAATLAKPAIEAVESGKTVFVPKNWENTYYEWMRNIQPWCISRQLWWGHQIPAWYGPEASVFVAESEEEAKREAKAKFGKDVELKRDSDILDTWFSAALWPFSTLGWPDKTPELDKYYPTDVLVTGFDIIFFWVARMMMMGIHFMGDVPFKTVYIHALVRDAQGQKMSKSKGNVMDPLDLIEKFGADALRFTLIAMSAQGRDIKLSEERLEGYRNFATKLWNATRYCEMNNCLSHGADFDPVKLAFSPNGWIVSELAQMCKSLEQAVAGYKFNEAAAVIYQFIWGTFCDWYLEFTKSYLQEDTPQSAEIRQTTSWVLEQILILLHPFMPFVTEEIYEATGKRKNNKDRLITATWPVYDFKNYDNAVAEMIWVQRLISEIRSIRSDMNVPAKARLQLLVKDASPVTKARIESYNEIIRRMARLENIEMTKDVPKGSLQTVLNEATLIMPVADIIDLDQERARLRKVIEKIDQDIQKISMKLENREFVQNAPEEVIEEHRARKTEAQNTRKKLALALKHLEAA